MTRVDRFFWLSLLLGLLVCLPRACFGVPNFQEYRISEIQNPTDLADDLQDIQFQLLKRGEFGSRVAILDLGFRRTQIYQNPEYLSRVDLSPDSTQLVYVRMVSLDELKPIWLYLVDLESEVEVKIAGWNVNYDEISISNPSFNPDGESVLFTVTWYDTGMIGLARVQSDGTGLTILDTELPMNEGPVSSPDHSLIIVTCGGSGLTSGPPVFQLCLLDQKGGFIERLPQGGAGYNSYAFTPDGEKVVWTEFDFGGVFGILKKPQYRLIIHDLRSGDQDQLLDWEVQILGFSPDGSELAFLGRRNPRTAWAIYLIRSDGTSLRHLAYFDDFLTEWYQQEQP